MTDSKDDRIRGLEDEARRLRAMLESAPDFYHAHLPRVS